MPYSESLEGISKKPLVLLLKHLHAALKSCKFLGVVVAHLCGPQVVVPTCDDLAISCLLYWNFEKLIMCAFLHDAPLVHDDYGIATLYGRETVRNHDGAPTLVIIDHFVERSLNNTLC